MEIKTHYLKAALFCAGSKDIRYYLNGVLIRTNPKGGISIVATNGHFALLGRADGKMPDASDLVIPRETIEAAIKFKQEKLELVYEGGTWRLGPISFKPLDGTFPDINRIIPDPPTFRGLGGTFNPDHLSAVNKALNAWDETRSNFYTIHHNDIKSSALLCSEDGNAFVVLMPGKGSGNKIVTFNV